MDGRAGFYGGLSVKPTLAYEGGKYRLLGQAILAGDVGLSAQVDAFVRLHVGKWMFSWEKEWDWKLAEWHKWLGLSLGMEADLDYTLGQPLSPDIFKLKKPDSIDVQEIAKSAMPKDGMPPQGPNGAQHEHEEFKQKGGGGTTAMSGPAAQPKVASTPAGGAGHKNQDPKGKAVKPAKPAKAGPAKKAKGKGPDQTGPNPKSKSKPTEPKVDATPIVEQFSMHGEQHQLIVQLGPGGHVDMASKRERLSVKVGHAVSKLIAKHAPPGQISDLKEIGALAKKDDKMVATAKVPDKKGTTQAAKQIAAYGTKWQVRDLDEVAIKVPRSLVVLRPLQIKEVTETLAKALAAVKADQVLFNKPGDPREVARHVLEEHKEARFEFESAKLTLASPKPEQLATASSASQVGALLAQQTGVSKVAVKTTADKGDTRFEFTGEVGATGKLGTAIVKGDVPKTLTMPGHAKLDKPTDALSEDLAKATSGATAWQSSVTDPRQVTADLLRAHADARFDRITKNLQLPAVKVASLSTATSLAQLGQMLGDQTGVSRVTVDIAGDHLDLLGHINPVVKEVGVEDEPWLKAVKKAVGNDKGAELCSRLTKPTLKKLWETLGEQPFKDLVTAFLASEDIKDLVGAFGVAKLKAVIDEIAAVNLATLKHDLTLQVLKSLITALPAATLNDLIAATDVGTVVALAKGLPAKDLKTLVTAFPPVDLKTFIDKLTVAGLIEMADKIGVSALTRAKGHFGGTPLLLELLEAAKAATTTSVLKDILAACYKNGFKTVGEIRQFFAHVTGLSEAQVRDAIHGAEIFVNESTGNMNAYGGRTTPDSSAPVQKNFVVQGGVNVTLTFNAADVRHISSRHTWAGFAMIPSNQAVKGDNTMFPAGTTDANLWQWGRDIMNCSDTATLLASMTPGQNRLNVPVNAGQGFKISVNLSAANGLVTFYADGGAGVIRLAKQQMKAAIQLWKSK